MREPHSKPVTVATPLTMGSETFTTISPTTGQAILTRPSISDADIALLPAIATQAFNSYKHTPLPERQATVKKALQSISSRQDALAREITEQVGRPISYTGKEISTAVARGEYLLKISGECLADTAGEAEAGFKRFIRKEPIGPVLILFAWNVCKPPAPPLFPSQLHFSHSYPCFHTALHGLRGLTRLTQKT